MIVLTKTDMKLIEFLLRNQKSSFSIRELARKTKIDYKLIHNSIERLMKKKLIIKEKLRKLDLCKINFNVDPKYFVFIENMRKEKFLNKYSDISILWNDLKEKSINPFFIFLIFGSYASGKIHKESDIDMMLIVQERKQIILFEKIINNIVSIRPLKLHPIIITYKDFTDMLQSREKLNVGKEAFRNNTIIYGVEMYYKLIRDALYD